MTPLCSKETSPYIRLTRLRAQLPGAPPVMGGLDEKERATEPLPKDPVNIATTEVVRRIPQTHPQWRRRPRIIMHPTRSATDTAFPNPQHSQEAEIQSSLSERVFRRRTKLMLRIHRDLSELGWNQTPPASPGNVPPVEPEQRIKEEPVDNSSESMRTVALPLTPESLLDESVAEMKPDQKDILRSSENSATGYCHLAVVSGLHSEREFETAWTLSTMRFAQRDSHGC
ncbi:hypothetical protein HIM_01318 [Hirsutella minnesotensis 3608]|nr:hypothetical protein HIM_01318 [Hirsutella minnesotensis 3608]